MAKIAGSMTRRTALSKKDTERSGFSSEERAEIERLAYQFFVGRGFQHGFDREDWLKAEAIVRNRR